LLEVVNKPFVGTYQKKKRASKKMVLGMLTRKGTFQTLYGPEDMKGRRRRWEPQEKKGGEVIDTRLVLTPVTPERDNAEEKISRDNGGSSAGGGKDLLEKTRRGKKQNRESKKGIRNHQGLRKDQESLLKIREDKRNKPGRVGLIVTKTPQDRGGKLKKQWTRKKKANGGRVTPQNKQKGGQTRTAPRMTPKTVEKGGSCS